MTSRGFAAFANRVRNSDEYWVERAKITFAEDLYRQMESHGVTRAQLADRIGASAAYITKVLRGDTNFTIDTMVRLVRAVDPGLTVLMSVAGTGISSVKARARTSRLRSRGNSTGARHPSASRLA
jgi:transcriptional regulator with XRE-family HTH domain